MLNNLARNKMSTRHGLARMELHLPRIWAKALTLARAFGRRISHRKATLPNVTVTAPLCRESCSFSKVSRASVEKEVTLAKFSCPDGPRILQPEFEVNILEIPYRPNSPTFESGMQNINGSCSSLGGIGGRREPESAQPLVEQKIVPCVEAAFLLWWCSFRNRVSRGLMVIRSACQRFKPSETLFALPSF
ncbi:hypothetical protein TWF128_011703 [Orbilia oligospora]|nr:hypothetical protein TWF128_011703 [Orbilia oligospora]